MCMYWCYENRCVFCRTSTVKTNEFWVSIWNCWVQSARWHSYKRSYVCKNCIIVYFVGGWQYGRSSKPVLGNSSTAATSTGGNSRVVGNGSWLADAVLQSDALQADAHHLLSRRCQRGTVCDGACTRTTSHSRGLHETGDRISAGNNVCRCAEKTPHATVLCRQAWPGIFCPQ